MSTSETTTLSLDSPYDLPAHSQQALLNALCGEDVPVKVTGFTDHAGRFVPTRIEDVFDADEGCWTSEYGSVLYPMEVR